MDVGILGPIPYSLPNREGEIWPRSFSKAVTSDSTLKAQVVPRTGFLGFRGGEAGMFEFWGQFHIPRSKPRGKGGLHHAIMPFRRFRPRRH